MAEIEIRVAADAERIAKNLITRYHSHLANPDEVRILFLFTTQKRSSRGKATLASTHKLTPLQRFLSAGKTEVEKGEHFLVLINLYVWAALSEPERLALIDHELTHIGYDDDEEVYVLRPHDVEEFGEIIARHGLWQPGLRDFAEAAGEQLALFGSSV